MKIKTSKELNKLYNKLVNLSYEIDIDEHIDFFNFMEKEADFFISRNGDYSSDFDKTINKIIKLSETKTQLLKLTIRNIDCPNYYFIKSEKEVNNIMNKLLNKYNKIIKIEKDEDKVYTEQLKKQEIKRLEKELNKLKRK